MPSGQQIWSILLHPANPGADSRRACPARLFRSADAGRTWTEPTARIQQGCPRIINTRLTALCARASNPRILWAGVEIDGVHRSTDGGNTWHAVGKGLSSQDIHALAFVPAGEADPPA